MKHYIIHAPQQVAEEAVLAAGQNVWELVNDTRVVTQKDWDAIEEYVELVKLYVTERKERFHFHTLSVQLPGGVTKIPRKGCLR